MSDDGKAPNFGDAFRAGIEMRVQLQEARERERELIGLLREAHRIWGLTSPKWFRDSMAAIAAFDAREKGQG